MIKSIRLTYSEPVNCYTEYMFSLTNKSDKRVIKFVRWNHSNRNISMGVICKWVREIAMDTFILIKFSIWSAKFLIVCLCWTIDFKLWLSQMGRLFFRSWNRSNNQLFLLRDLRGLLNKNRVTYISGYHWFRSCHVDLAATSHNSNQCWQINGARKWLWKCILQKKGNNFCLSQKVTNFAISQVNANCIVIYHLNRGYGEQL